MACSHLILCQRASLITGNASCTAQCLNSLKILDKNIHVLHLDSSDIESDSELIPQVRPQQKRNQTLEKRNNLWKQPFWNICNDDSNGENKCLGKSYNKILRNRGVGQETDEL